MAPYSRNSLRVEESCCSSSFSTLSAALVRTLLFLQLNYAQISLLFALINGQKPEASLRGPEFPTGLPHPSKYAPWWMRSWRWDSSFSFLSRWSGSFQLFRRGWGGNQTTWRFFGLPRGLASPLPWLCPLPGQLGPSRCSSLRSRGSLRTSPEPQKSLTNPMPGGFSTSLCRRLEG